MMSKYVCECMEAVNYYLLLSSILDAYSGFKSLWQKTLYRNEHMFNSFVCTEFVIDNIEDVDVFYALIIIDSSVFKLISWVT